MRPPRNECPHTRDPLTNRCIYCEVFLGPPTPVIPIFNPARDDTRVQRYAEYMASEEPGGYYDR